MKQKTDKLTEMKEQLQKGENTMDRLKQYVDQFNCGDEEVYGNLIDNDHALAWLAEEIPLLECPDPEIEEIYYFRWWTYRKHLKMTDDGYIVTEFLPKVSWSGKHNEINAAVGHHLYEGRWLKNASGYLKDYIYFFLEHPDRGHQYSAWMIYAVYQMCTVTGNWDLGPEFLAKACAYYELWEETHKLSNGMFWSIDNYDAMECSVSGTTEDIRFLKGIRPTLNSYMCADAWAIAEFAKRQGREEICQKYLEKYEHLKKAVNENLWQDGFYRAFHFENGQEGLSCEDMVKGWLNRSPRELIGYIPWMFHIPEPGKENVFDALTDPEGFYTAYGLTTVETVNPRFLYEVNHECLWNGYVWPFATAQTLTAMGNMVREYPEGKRYREAYLQLVKQYAKMHRRIREDGKEVPWIDEVKHPLREEWSSREILKNWGWTEEKGGYERGKDYNHSTFCDIILSGVLGIGFDGDELKVNPCIPQEWEYFKVENLHAGGNTYTVVYDKSGEKYGCGKGVMIQKH